MVINNTYGIIIWISQQIMTKKSSISKNKSNNEIDRIY